MIWFALTKYLLKMDILKSVLQL